jgi:hypothetical protein
LEDGFGTEVFRKQRGGIRKPDSRLHRPLSRKRGRLTRQSGDDLLSSELMLCLSGSIHFCVTMAKISY